MEKGNNVVRVKPICLDIEMMDPDLAYASVQGRDTYLLESAEGGEKVARYSFIGFNPIARISIKGGRVRFESDIPGLKKLKARGDGPVEVVRGILSHIRLEGQGRTRFFGGLVGYFAYDTVRYYTKLEEKRDELKEPDCEFVISKNNIIFDHKAKRAILTQNEFGDFDAEESREELENIYAKIREGIKKRGGEGAKVGGVESNMKQNEFERIVERAKRYIEEGDVVQVVLSQRFETRFEGDGFSVFQRLKRINPSPYMYYLDLGERKVVGSSPEMLARVVGKSVMTYPIAGTRPRGVGEEDRRLERELLSDEKERAEHLMLVDLGRNDIGRVAKFGSVQVKKFMEVEKYSHVQHMVSEVVGKLQEGRDCLDAFKSIFPAGTVSGAPKVRAMEIINELEPSRRGIYAGAVGYLSFSGNMDMAIAIRTVVIERNRAYVQAGAGIVADSVPEREYRETVNKAKGMIEALERQK